MRWVTVMFWDAKQIRYKILYRDGTDAWVTGETLDAAIKCNEIYTPLEKTNAALEEWHPSVFTTLQGYGLYCAKHVGPTLPLPPQRFALPETALIAGTTPPLASLLRAAFSSQSLGPTTTAAAYNHSSPPLPMATDAITLTTAALSDVSGAYLAGMVQPDPQATTDTAPSSDQANLIPSTAIAPTTEVSDGSATAPPNVVEPHLLSKPAITPTTVVVPRGTPAAATSKVLDPNLKSRLAKLRTSLTAERHTKSGTLVWALGQVMCFMLPKQSLLPSKLVNVYGILAHDVS